jgi:gluconate kinase
MSGLSSNIRAGHKMCHRFLKADVVTLSKPVADTQIISLRVNTVRELSTFAYSKQCI